MPRGDRTGPRGLGPRTGRGLGYCSGFSAPGNTKEPAMSMGWGGGRCRGWRRGWGRGASLIPYPLPPGGPTMLDPQEESKYLEVALTGLKSEIKRIEERLKELASDEKE